MAEFGFLLTSKDVELIIVDSCILLALVRTMDWLSPAPPGIVEESDCGMWLEPAVAAEATDKTGSN